MIPTDILNPTNKLTPPENWDAERYGPCSDLLVRVDTEPFIMCSSAWRPSDAELAALNEGAVVQVSLAIPNQCVMSVGVVDAVPDGLAKYAGR